MDALVENFQLFALIGVIAVVASAQLDRRLGASVAVVFYAALAVVGTEVYARGGALGLGGFQFSQPLFYGFVAALFSISVLPVFFKRHRPRARVED